MKKYYLCICSLIIFSLLISSCNHTQDNPVSHLTAPIAFDDKATIFENTQLIIDVLVNDSDTDGDLLIVTNLSQPTKGTTTINSDDTITYIPDTDYIGFDSFSYTAYDGMFNSNIATVGITIAPITDITSPSEGTITVAASDSSQQSKSEADYVCTATNFHTVMAEVITSLPVEGGSILLMDGTYYMTDSDGIEISKDNIHISGSGKDTLIKIAGGILPDLSIFKANGRSDIVIENLRLHGNEDQQDAGVQWAIDFTNVSSSRLSAWIEYFSGGEVRVPGSEVEVTNLFCEDNEPLVILDCSTDEGPWVEDEVSGGASYEIDTSDYVDGGSSLKLTLPRGSKIRIRNYAFSDLYGGKYSDLRWKRLTWSFKIECNSPVHFATAHLELNNWQRMVNSWEYSTDWMQCNSEIYYPSESLDNSDAYIVIEFDNTLPNSSDCTVWMDRIYAEPTYPESPVATFSLDDGFFSWRQIADILNEYGYKACFNVVTSGIYWTQEKKDMYREFAEEGHEIASHSLTHAFRPQSIWEELIESRMLIEAEGWGDCRNFVKPGTGYQWYGSMLDSISTVYAGFRNTANYGNGSVFPIAWGELGAFSDEELYEFIITKIKQHEWLILYDHGMKFDPEYDPNGTVYDGITEERVRYACDLLSEFGVPVKTHSEVATEARFPDPHLGESVESAEVVQSIGPCAPTSNTSVHLPVNLTSEEQVITTDITNPDVYRCLRISSDRPASTPTRAQFLGTGLNDMTSAGTYTGYLASSLQEPHQSYIVQIDSIGDTDTFKWKLDTLRWGVNSGSWIENVPITGGPQLLSDGITVTFAATTGHTLGDAWAFQPLAEVRILGTSWDDLERMETIYLTSDTDPIDGRVPFKSISAIYLPAEPDGGSGHSISIGTCDKLGLYHMIVSSSDIIEQTRMAAGTDQYITEPIGEVDAYYNTIDVSTTSPIAQDDSFEFYYNTLLYQ